MAATTGAVLGVALVIALLPIALFLTRTAGTRGSSQCPARRGSLDLEAP